MTRYLDPDAWSVYDWRTDAPLPGAPTLALVRESLAAAADAAGNLAPEAGTTGAVWAEYDHDEGLWHFVSDGEDAPDRDARLVYVLEDEE